MPYCICIDTFKLKKVMEQKGISREDLIERTGRGRKCIEYYITKPLNYPDISDINSIARALDVELSEITTMHKELTVWRVERLRRSRGITAITLAEGVGVALASVHRWSTGSVLSIRPKVLRLIAEYFDVPVDYLINGTPDSARSRTEFAELLKAFGYSFEIDSNLIVIRKHENTLSMTFNEYNELCDRAKLLIADLISF